MAWNEPGKDDDKDPWGGKRKNEEDELEESLRQFQNKLKSLFKNGGRHSKGFAGGSGLPVGGPVVLMGLGILFALWLVSGIYIVGPAEEAVVLRFGAYNTEVKSGPHWAPRFIDTVYKVNVEAVSSYSYKADMLTGDENLVTVSLDVPYKINNPRDYLFNVVSPERGLREASASALRQVIGKSTLKNVLTTGKEKVRQEVEAQLKSLMLKYGNGIEIGNVALKDAQPPEKVKAAFDNAINAQEKEQTFINEATAESELILGQAKGVAKKVVNEAKGYKEKVVLNAKADTAGYLALLPEYNRAKRVTRERLYYDAMLSVFKHSTKLVIGVGGSNNMFYLPLDKIMQQAQNRTSESIVVDEKSIADSIRENNVLKSASRSSRSRLTRPTRFAN